MKGRALAVGLSLLLLAGFLVPAGWGGSSGLAPSPGLSVLASGVAAEDVEALGLSVVDDYGAFLHVHGAPEAIAALGPLAHVQALDFTTGRGHYRFDGAEGDGLVPEALRLSYGEVGYYLVQFRGPVMAAWAADLAAQAGRVYGYLPENAFIAKLAADAAARLAVAPEVRFLGAYHAGYKLSPLLDGATGTVDATVLVFDDADLARVVAKLEAAGATVRASIHDGWDGIVKAGIPPERLADVARIHEVSWIEPALDEAGLDNEFASAISQGWAPAQSLPSQVPKPVREAVGGGATGPQWPLHAKGIDGSSQLLSVCDTGVDTSGGTSFTMIHEMFADGSKTLQLNVPDAAHRKVLLYYAPIENGQIRGGNDDENGHGTHTAGTVAGDAPDAGSTGTRNLHDGVAFNGKLLVCDVTSPSGAFQILNDYANYWNPAYALGSRINSNSWGSAHTNVYTEKARQHDAYVWKYRDMLIFRSMGNTGKGGSIRPEAVAKSAFGIGALENLPKDPESLASFTTRGPTTDGRLKPDVTAPGDCLQSAARGTTTGYSCLSGTSMSTPTVAGAAGLIRDYFAKGYYPTGKANAADARNPSTALVRALLYNSGREIQGKESHLGTDLSQYPPALQPAVAQLAGKANVDQNSALLPLLAQFPNANQGWGRVSLDDVLHFEGETRNLLLLDEAAGLATGQEFTTTFTVASAGERLKVTLAWSDYPGTPGAGKDLVNDLDLIVEGPTALHYFGNQFWGSESVPVEVSGVTAGDHKNIGEGVHVRAPAAGIYKVTVRGTNVAMGPQPFALVVTGDLL